MRHLSKAVLFAFALSAFSTVGFSAEEKDKPGGAGAAGMPSFTQADKDKSGSVEQSEAAGIAGLDFTTADKDKDGKLSRSEFEAATKAGGKKQ